MSENNNLVNDCIKQLRAFLPEKVDYADLVCADPQWHGFCKVWEDPEPYAMEEAANLLESMQKEVDRYHQFEAAGRLVILPCKVGTPVYVIAAARENGRAWLGVNKMRFRLSDVDKWGKTVFATRDEAMAAASLRRVNKNECKKV